MWFRKVIGWAGIVPSVDTGNFSVQARLHRSEETRYLWLVKPAAEAQPVAVRVDGRPMTPAAFLWGDAETAGIPDRDALIVPL